jgi:tRNA-2-methylthio-N6-dimethylallyladenosine synthase
MTETKPPKFYTETFGCQMNAADSEEMGRALLARGFAPAGTREEADWLLVNTCTVRDHAEHRALSFLGRLKEWKASSPSRRIVVAGCAAERLKDELGTRFPHVDLVVGAKSIGAFAGLLDPLLPAAAREPFNGRGEQEGAWAAETDYTSFLSADAVTGHVTIMRGCNYSCTYCIVPAVRGREVYRPAESVLAEVRQKAARGLSEIMLLGQTVNSYRPAAPGPADFAELLRAVDAVPGVRRIRYMSPHPFYVTEKFAKTLSECANVCPHIHLPVQSGSDAVLKRMRRNYARAEYLEKLALLRRAVPHISVTTDFIVGFPGETEEDFLATLSLAEEAGIDAAFCFKYSPRPGTDAAALADDVPREVKEERLARLQEKCDALTAPAVKRLSGTRQEVLVDRAADDGSYEGRTRSFWKIGFSSSKALRPGMRVDVAVAEADGRALRGAVCS